MALHNNLTHTKNFNFLISKWRPQRYGDTWGTKVGKPWREKGGPPHADMVSEGFAASWTTTSQENSHDMNLLQTIGNIIDETTFEVPAPIYTGRAKTVTTLHLEKCDFRRPQRSRTFYTSPLRKCQKTLRKAWWLLISQLVNIQWTVNNMFGVTK